MLFSLGHSNSDYTYVKVCRNHYYWGLSVPSLDMTKHGTIRVRYMKLVDEDLLAQADKEGVQQF
jgi:hypothetical protein